MMTKTTKDLVREERDRILDIVEQELRRPGDIRTLEQILDAIINMVYK